MIDCFLGVAGREDHLEKPCGPCDRRCERRIHRGGHRQDAPIGGHRITGMGGYECLAGILRYRRTAGIGVFDHDCGRPLRCDMQISAGFHGRDGVVDVVEAQGFAGKLPRRCDSGFLAAWVHIQRGLLVWILPIAKHLLSIGGQFDRLCHVVRRWLLIQADGGVVSSRLENMTTATFGGMLVEPSCESVHESPVVLVRRRDDTDRFMVLGG